VDAVASEESKMLKRTVLALTFVAALCAAGFGMSGTAQARHGCGYGGGGYYGGSGYGHGGYYSSYRPYYGGYGYRSYYGGHGHHGGYGHHGHHGHHDHGHSGLYFSFGF
jgi:hypothetical protein